MELRMKQGEKLLALLSGGLLSVALAWALLSGDLFKSPAGLTEAGAGVAFETNEARVDGTPSPVVWRQPKPQGGPDWVFDIFTPPVIYYDQTTGAFTVTPPFPDTNPLDESFGLQLVDFQPVPFRFQLVSYAGASGNYLLTLENLETGKDLFCSPGEELPDQQLRVLGFREKREVTASALSGTTEAFDLVGELSVEDRRTGRRYSLRHDKTTFTDHPLAVFLTDNGRELRLNGGGNWVSDGHTYSVTSIDPAAGTATVEKISMDANGKMVKVLQLRNSVNPSDLSNRSTRLADSPPAAF